MVDPRSAPVTVPEVRAAKVRNGHQPLVMVTAYDAPSARIVDAAGVDLILVGDSVANVVLGYEDTLQVTIGDMAHHVGAVARAKPGALIVGDLPWMSYHVDVADTVRNGATLIRAGAQCVKLEGGAVRAPMVEALVNAEIPVMGHLGLTPQSVNTLGGFRVQARDDEAAAALIAGAQTLVAAGVFAVVVEGVPEKVGCALTEALVLHDLLGVTERTAKFVRRYATMADDATAAVAAFAADVRSGAFPADAEVYH
jgi:3-methyl-2-oxobutanoate hydroxymethyltransferase